MLYLKKIQRETMNKISVFKTTSTTTHRLIQLKIDTYLHI